jgi:hypothetical protein
MMLDGYRVGPSRPIGLVRTTGKIDPPESRDSLGAKWTTHRLLMSREETPGENGREMFSPAIPQGRTTRALGRRRHGATQAVTDLALPHHRIAGAAGRRRRRVEALIRVVGTALPAKAADATVNAGFSYSVGC